MSDTDHLLFKFREHLQVLNRSAATIRGYTNYLKVFLRELGETDMKRVTRSMIETYIAGLYDVKTRDNKPYRTATICLKVRSVKRFFEFLEKANVIFVNPTETIQEPRIAKGLVKDVLTPGEVRKILDQPNLGTRKGIRDRTILEVFYSTGIRLKELCSLTIYDPDLQGQMLRVNQGKGKKDRIVPMGKHAARFLREYVTRVRPHYVKKTGARSQNPGARRNERVKDNVNQELRNSGKERAKNIEHGAKSTEYGAGKHPASSIQKRTLNREPGTLNRLLFVDVHGGQISVQAVEKMVRRYAGAAGIKKQVSPHTFRHSFATSLVKNGADITAVQKMLGHARLITTEVYIRSLGLDVKRVHRKTHPREKDKERIEVPKVSHRPLR